MNKILIGNAFSLALVRRKVTIEPCSREDLADAVEGGSVFSFWGHGNTLKAASEFSGIDLTPAKERPVLKLSEKLQPLLDGKEFSECWVLSPDYVNSFRPAIGEEVKTEKIKDWTVLKITWE